jgi:hypothetical protein
MISSALRARRAAPGPGDKFSAAGRRPAAGTPPPGDPCGAAGAASRQRARSRPPALAGCGPVGPLCFPIKNERS